MSPVLRVPAAVVAIVRTLTDAGYETWCVGGAVRDALLAQDSLDWDIATAAHPQVVRKLFRRTVPVGIEFGTVGVLDQVGTLHEVTTFRRDVHTDGRHAVVEFGASLDDDLARRDFTINAIAYNPLDQRIYDPFDGRVDLSAQLVRAVGNAEARLNEDRLRALRAIRFAARFGFEIEETTWQAIVGSAPHLGRLSPERIKQEIEKTVEQIDAPSSAFRRWRESKAFASLIPALANVSDRTLLAVDAVRRPGVPTRPQRRTLRIAVLFAELDGRAAEEGLRALRFSNHDIGWISGLVSLWRELGESLTVAMRAPEAPSDEDLRRLAARTGRLRFSAFYRFAAAHWNASGASDSPDAARIHAVYRRGLRVAFRDAIELADLAIDGDDLRGAGIAAGPLYGPLLSSLLQAVIEDPARNERTALLAQAHAYVASAERARAQRQSAQGASEQGASAQRASSPRARSDLL
jgi:tRNA nucleotidyltransferase (CCA-adding enzyme)